MSTKRNFVIFFIIWTLFIGSGIHTVSGDRMRSGNGVLATGQVFTRTIDGSPNGRIEVSIDATEGPLWIFVLQSDRYVNVSSIQSFDCVVHELDSHLEDSFSVDTPGEWILVLQNTNPFDVHFEYTLTSIEASTVAVTTFTISITTIYLLLTLVGYIYYAHRGVLPELANAMSNSKRPAIIGAIFILFSLLLPGMPYAMLLPLLFIGPTALFPFALMSYYQGRSTKHRMVVMGVLSILPSLVLVSLSGLSMLINPTYPLIEIPLPLVFILGLVVSKYIPAPT